MIVFGGYDVAAGVKTTQGPERGAMLVARKAAS